MKTKKILSQASKGALATAGFSFLSYSLDCARNENYLIAIGLGAIGLGCIILFTILVEKQASEEAVKKVIRTLKKS